MQRPFHLEAIGRALGESRPYEEWRGEAEHHARRVVIEAAVDPNDERRVAWIEEIVAPGGTPGSVPIDFQLRVATGKGLAVVLGIETYNPYFGCECGFLEWRGDRVIAIYREKHRTLVWSVPVMGGERQLVSIGHNYVIDGDLVVFNGTDPCLLETMDLVALAPRTPLVVREDGRYADLTLREDLVRFTAESGAPEAVRPPSKKQQWFPPDGEAFRLQVERALFGETPAPPGAALVTGAVASTFWMPWRAVGAAYDSSRSMRPDIRWLPAYWHRHLAKAGAPGEAGEFLAMLDTMAKPLPPEEPETGWDPGWEAEAGAVILAARYVRRRARVLADVCRTGMLPRDEYCTLWNSLVPQDLAGFPRAVQVVHETLAATKPEILIARDRGW